MLPLALPGPIELYLIVGVVLVLFGAKKLPELARALGQSVTELRRGVNEFEELGPGKDE